MKRRTESQDETIEVVLDRALGQSRIEAFRDAILKFEDDAAAAIFDASDSWNERQHMIDVVSHIDGRPPQITNWPERQPGCPLAFLVRGAHGNVWAMSERRHKRADWATTIDRLKQAEADLRQVSLLVPEDALSKLAMLRSAKVLDTPLDEMLEQFEQIRRLAPDFVAPYADFLQCVSAKWSGTHESMFKFARHVSASAPDGSPLHSLVAIAHLQFFVAQDKLTPQQYFKGDVKAEIHAAAKRCVLNRTFFRQTDFAPKIDVLNVFAMAAFFCDEQKLTSQLMDIIGDNLITEFPWTYFEDNAIERYQRFRRINADLLDRGRTGTWI